MPTLFDGFQRPHVLNNIFIVLTRVLSDYAFAFLLLNAILQIVSIWRREKMVNMHIPNNWYRSVTGEANTLKTKLVSQSMSVIYKMGFMEYAFLKPCKRHTYKRLTKKIIFIIAEKNGM